MRATYEPWTSLELGARGRLDGAPFTLASRTAIRGRRGAVWNEWTVRFDDGRTLFLAEAAGAFTLYDEGSLTPPLARIAVGGPLDTGFVVVERGEATRVAQWGTAADAPASYAYVDLSGPDGTLASIDYGSIPPRVFVGRRVTPVDLGLAARLDQVRFIPVPDVSRPKGVEAWLTPGEVGELRGTRFRVVGAVSRSTGSSEQERTRWDEYLLFEAAAGLRWLVVADGHWTIVEPLEAGRVEELRSGSVVIDGVTYEPLSEGVARVDWATGELPWEVTIGETANVKDFVHPSSMLTRESTEDDLTWSRGTSLAPEAIVKAFGRRPLPKPTGRAPHAG